MADRIDEVDRRILHALMGDPRNRTVASIAEGAGVSSGTVRNRIERLEHDGVIEGYHTGVNFEAATGALVNLYVCNAPVSEREALAGKVRTLPNVVNVRELMTGRRNLHVVAVGEDTIALRRIARDISRLGIDIEDENLVQNETFHPYTPFGPEDETREAISDFVTLAGGSEIAEVTVHEGAPVAGRTVREAVGRGLLDEEVLVIAVERDDTVRTAHGDVELRAGDLVTVFSRGGVSDETLSSFRPRRLR